jgi:hypothetical protein
MGQRFEECGVWDGPILDISVLSGGRLKVAGHFTSRAGFLAERRTGYMFSGARMEDMFQV